MPVVAYPEVKLWIINEKGEAIFGDGLAALLEAIDKYKSVSAASEHLKMSYRYALHRISLSEKRVGCELVKRHRGGAAKGFSEVTKDGKELVIKYRKTEKKIKDFLRDF